MFRMTKIMLIGLLFSSVALADDDWDEHRHHRHHHHGHGREYYPAYSVERVYVPERVVEYVPIQQRYYAPPPPPPPVRYGAYDQRSPQGLVGGLVGSAMGYEMGRGDPLAAGIGAAAGSWIGNGMSR